MLQVLAEIAWWRGVLQLLGAHDELTLLLLTCIGVGALVALQGIKRQLMVLHVCCWLAAAQECTLALAGCRLCRLFW